MSSPTHEICGILSNVNFDTQTRLGLTLIPLVEKVVDVHTNDIGENKVVKYTIVGNKTTMKLVKKMLKRIRIRINRCSINPSLSPTYR